MSDLYELENNTVMTDDFDLSVLPQCPAHMINVAQDLSKVVGKSNEEIDSSGVEKYYASQLIELKQGDYPTLDILNKDKDKMSKDEQNQFFSFGDNMARLFSANDICDQEGIKYIATFLYHYYPGSHNFNTLKIQAQEYIESIISSGNNVSKDTVQKLAIKLINTLEDKKIING